MSTVLIVSGSYFPYATANAVCVKKFEDILKKEGHRVIYCNRKHDIYEPDFQVKDGTEIFTVGKNSDLFYQTIQRLKGLDLPNYMHNCFDWAYRCFRMFMKLRNIGKSSLKLRCKATKHYIERYAHEIVEIVEREEVDMVMSVSMPFDSHKAVKCALDIMSEKGIQGPKWVVYSIDAYWSKAGIPPAEVPIKKSEEKEIFDTCDMIIFLDTIEKDYSGKEYDDVRGKMRSLPLPLFDLKPQFDYRDGITPSKEGKDVVFTGTIYDNYTTVDEIADIIRKSNDTRAHYHFMGKIYPKSLAVLDGLAKEFPDRIHIYGRKSYEYAKGSMQRGDILLNLANDNSNQIPSKIFEYIATCKPIINVYRQSNDIGAMYLEKYPLAFNFNVNDFDQNIKEFNSWFSKISDKSVSLEELRNIYSLSLTETVARNYYNMVIPYLASNYGQK